MASSQGFSGAEIRAQLNKLLASDIFARSERLSGLLKYVVERTLEGNQHILKEQTIAQEFFGRGAEFEGSADPIVRVEARRLRDKLREYYASANADSILITLPKGTYVPSFQLNPANVPAMAPPQEDPTVPPPARRSRLPTLTAVIVAGVVVAGGTGWYAVQTRAASGAFRNHAPAPITPATAAIAAHRHRLVGFRTTWVAAPDSHFWRHA